MFKLFVINVKSKNTQNTTTGYLESKKIGNLCIRRCVTVQNHVFGEPHVNILEQWAFENYSAIIDVSDVKYDVSPVRRPTMKQTFFVSIIVSKQWKPEIQTPKCF